mmetsp:Transcript_11864/g.11786  ORF Transcript_11864/g.11786 Transcript_11864/m.11786 type:complete len:86 (+) Transcript_11864:521-778(+)
MPKESSGKMCLQDTGQFPPSTFYSVNNTSGFNTDDRKINQSSSVETYHQMNQGSIQLKAPAANANKRLRIKTAGRYKRNEPPAEV